jgi:hypothetical protein
LGSQSATAASAQYVYAESHVVQNTPMGAVGQESSQTGTASVELTKSAQSDTLTVRVTSATVPDRIGTKTLSKVGLPIAFQGLPFAKLGGLYNGADTPIATVMSVNVNSTTGALSGQYDRDCQVSGTVYGYDSGSGMFKLDAALQGTGCAVSGTGTFVGRLQSSRYGHVVLQAMGIVQGKRMILSFTHSQQLGTY